MSSHEIKESNTQEGQRENKFMLIVISVGCFAVLSILMLFSGNQSALALNEEDLMLTQNTRVQYSNIYIQSEYKKPRSVYGQVESVEQSDIGFELSGTLKQLLVSEGASVKQGDLLAKLDTSRLLAKKNELQSSLKNAQANAKLARIVQQRVKALVRDKLEPQQRLDEVQAQLDAANALSDEASARIYSIDTELEKAQLKAPFDGQLVRQYIDGGTVLNAGQAVFSLLGKSSLEARFGLPEDVAFGMRANATYMLTIHNNSFPAKVKSVANQRNISTRTIDTVFTINVDELSHQQQQLVVAGDLVSLSVDLTKQKSGAWVPISALASGVRGLWTLYVISPSNQIQTRFVSVEYADEQRAYVSGAISNGDRLVVSGIHRLTPGQQVQNIEQVNIDELGQFAALQN